MPSERSSLKPIVLVAVLLGVPTAVGVWYALRPVVAPDSGKSEPTPARTPDPKAAAKAPEKPAAPAKAGDPADPHEVHPLSKWDGPFSFDPLAYVPEATTLAQKKYSDAVLVGLRFGQVKPVGRINLKSRDAFAAYRFRSPSRSAQGDTVGAEPCLIDLVITGDGVQVLTPKVPAVGCASPPLAVPECDLLTFWLLALQERTPTAPTASYELTAPPGASAAIGAAPAPGHWKLTMASSPAPLERLHDAACKPIGREKPVTPVDPARWRAEDAAAAAKPAPDRRPPNVLIRPLGEIPAAAQEAFARQQPAFAECFRTAQESCAKCAKAFEATFTLSIAADGKVSAAEVVAVSQPEKGEKPDAAAAQFGQCAQKAALAAPFPPAAGSTKAVFEVAVATRQHQHGGEAE